ncbi:hypothetical protein GALMADRAFT_1232498 [Galerina marginata CBS 339.88]|uniref:Uncharacterized protein n=1 Tax=Galerina marginata (strain CBS 339.88) TaxID=685588 RepID=A0A067T7W3_GALM3|nr:hypothetical protein GALMADRAFT_1232498 [Galerina marginata CBS 339.88]
MRSSIISLEPDNSLPPLSKHYHATLLALALQMRHIIDTLNTSGDKVISILLVQLSRTCAGCMSSCPRITTELWGLAR